MAISQALKACILLTLSTFANAQYNSYGGGGSGGGGGGYGNPYNNNNGGGGDGRDSAFGGNAVLAQIFATQRPLVVAHGVLAAAVFVFFFPVGAILVRLGNFPGLWLVHGLIQTFAYLLYIAAFGIGIVIAGRMRQLNNAHPIIGIILFVLLFFQPFLGLLHHVMFKKHSRRVVWSHGHVWLGRIIITLGIINGGLGLQLAQRLVIFAPSRGAVIAYGVVGGVMWLVYVVAAIVGERKRAKAVLPAPSKQSIDTTASTPNTNGVGEHQKNEHSAPQYA